MTTSSYNLSFLVPIVLTVCTFLGCCGGQNGRVQGRVFDRYLNEPIEGVTIGLAGTDVSVESNSDGLFKLKRIPPNDYVLQVRKEGYRSSGDLGIKVVAGETTDVDVITCSCTSQNCASLYGIEGAGRVTSMLDGSPVGSVEVTAGSELRATSDAAGDFILKNLLPETDYTLRVGDGRYIGDPVAFKTGSVLHERISIQDMIVLPEPPGSGVYALEEGDYTAIPEVPLKYYYLKYYAEGSDVGLIAQSGKGRFTIWYLDADDGNTLPVVEKGAKLVIWNRRGKKSERYYDGIAPLFFHEQHKIVGTKCSGRKVATLPEGWYSERRELHIGVYNIYCYAPITADSVHLSWKDVEMRTFHGGVILDLDLEPGRYVLKSSEMRGPGGMRTTRITSFPAAAFEVR